MEISESKKMYASQTHVYVEKNLQPAPPVNYKIQHVEV